MIKLLWSGFIIMFMVSGCGYNGTPTRSPQGIIPPTSIEIVPASLQIAAGTSTKLTAYGYFAGVRSEIAKPVVWKSDNPDVTITGQNKNRVSGLASGTANITATFDGVTSAPISLTVSNATVTGMTITTVPPTIPPATPTVLRGSTTQFAVTGTFSDSSTQDLTFDVTWSPSSSSPGAFATVSNDPASKGLATATAIGVETITATFIFDTTKFTTSTLTVIELQSIAVTPTDSSVAGLAKTVQFIATGTYSDGSTNSTKDISSTVIWASSLKSFATIAPGGLATSVAAGTTSISATLNGITGSTNLTVTAPVPSSLQITPVNPTLFLSTGTTTLQLTATAFYADNSSQIVTSSTTWEISPPSSIATVTAGLVTWTTGTTTGIVTVKATYLGQSITTNVNITQ